MVLEIPQGTSKQTTRRADIILSEVQFIEEWSLNTPGVKVGQLPDTDMLRAVALKIPTTGATTGNNALPPHATAKSSSSSAQQKTTANNSYSYLYLPADELPSDPKVMILAIIVSDFLLCIGCNLQFTVQFAVLHSEI